MHEVSIYVAVYIVACLGCRVSWQLAGVSFRRLLTHSHAQPPGTHSQTHSIFTRTCVDSLVNVVQRCRYEKQTTPRSLHLSLSHSLCSVLSFNMATTPPTSGPKVSLSTSSNAVNSRLSLSLRNL